MHNFTRLILPWPPTINHAYNFWRGRVVKKKAVNDFAKEVQAIVRRKGFEGFGTTPVAVAIQAFPPDRRRRDLDNIQKVLLDALQMAGCFDDDSQIDRLEIHRGPAMDGEGHVNVEIRELI